MLSRTRLYASILLVLIALGGSCSGEEILVYTDGAWTTGRAIRIDGERRLVKTGNQPERWFEQRHWRPRPQDHFADIGQAIQVQANGHWYRAVIMQKLPGLLLVRYEGYPENFVEWVGSERWRYITRLPAPAQNLSVGDKVLAYSSKQWFEAKILKVAPGRIFVRLDGFDERYDQWLTPDRWKVDSQPLPQDLPDLHPRLKVQALSNGNWYRATILKVEGERALVRFDDFGERYDTWVTESRLKPALTPPSLPIATGQKLEVYNNDIWYPATVIKVEDEDAFVRYDGFADQYNEWVGSERWRLVGTLPNPLRQPMMGQRILALHRGNWIPAKVRSVEPDRVLVILDGGNERQSIELTRENWRFIEGAQVPVQAPVPATPTRIYVQTSEGWVPGELISAEGPHKYVRLGSGREAWFGPGEWRESLVRAPIAVVRPAIDVKMSVQVLRGGKWYRGMVMEVDKDRYLINYTGYHDRPEWVPAERIRLPSALP